MLLLQLLGLVLLLLGLSLPRCPGWTIPKQIVVLLLTIVIVRTSRSAFTPLLALGLVLLGVGLLALVGLGLGLMFMYLVTPRE